MDEVGREVERIAREVTELERAVAPLAQSTSALAGIASQVSTLVISLAAEITKAGNAGRPFVPWLEKLSQIGRTSFEALKELQRQSIDCRARARSLVGAAEQARAASVRLAPALHAAQARLPRAEAPAAVVQQPPSPTTPRPPASPSSPRKLSRPASSAWPTAGSRTPRAPAHNPPASSRLPPAPAPQLLSFPLAPVRRGEGRGEGLPVHREERAQPEGKRERRRERERSGRDSGRDR